MPRSLKKAITTASKNLAHFRQQWRSKTTSDSYQKKQALSVFSVSLYEVLTYQGQVSTGAAVAFLQECFDTSRDILTLLPALDESVQQKGYEIIITIQQAYAQHCPEETKRLVVETLESTLALVREKRNGEQRTLVLEKKAPLELPAKPLGEEGNSESSSSLNHMPSPTMERTAAIPVEPEYALPEDALLEDALLEDVIKIGHEDHIRTSYNELHATLLALRETPHATLDNWFDLKQKALDFVATQGKRELSIKTRLQQTELVLRILSDYIDFCVNSGFLNKIAAPKQSMIRLFQRYVRDYEKTDAPESSKQALKEKVNNLHDYAFQSTEITFYNGLLKLLCVDEKEKTGAKYQRNILINKRESSISAMLEKYHSLIMKPMETLEHSSIEARVVLLKHQQAVLVEGHEDSIPRLYAIAAECLREIFLEVLQIPLNRSIGLINPPFMLTSTLNWYDWYGDPSPLIASLDYDRLNNNKNIGEIVQLYFYYQQWYVSQEMVTVKKTKPAFVPQLENDLFIIKIRLEMYRFLFQPIQAAQCLDKIANDCHGISSSLYATVLMKKLASNALQHLESIRLDEELAFECMNDPELKESDEVVSHAIAMKGPTPSKQRKQKKKQNNHDTAIFNDANDREMMRLNPPCWNQYVHDFISGINTGNLERALEVVNYWIMDSELDFTGDPNFRSQILFNFHLDKVFTLKSLSRYTDAKDCLLKMNNLYLIDPSFKTINLQQKLIVLCKQAEIDVLENRMEDAIQKWEKAEQLAENNGTFCFESIWNLKLKHPVIHDDFLDELCDYFFESETLIIQHNSQWNYFYFCYDHIARFFAYQSLQCQSDARIESIHRDKSIKITQLLLRYSHEFFPGRLFDIYHVFGLDCAKFYFHTENVMYRKQAQEAFSNALEYPGCAREKESIKIQISKLSRKIHLKSDLQKFADSSVFMKQKRAFFNTLMQIFKYGMPATDDISTISQLNHAIEDYFFFFEIRNVLWLLKNIFEDARASQIEIKPVVDGMMLDALIHLMRDIMTHEANLRKHRFSKKNLPADEKRNPFSEWWWTETHTLETLLETLNIFSLIFNESVDTEINEEMQKETLKKQNNIETIKKKVEEANFVALPTKVDLGFTTQEQSIFTLPSMSNDYRRGLAALIQNKPSYALHYLSNAFSAMPDKQQRKSSEVLIAYCSIWLLKAFHTDAFQRHIEDAALNEYFIDLHQCIYSQTKRLLAIKNQSLFGDTIKRSMLPIVNGLPRSLQIQPKHQDEDQKEPHLKGAY